MRVYGGPTVDISDDTARRVGRVNIMDSLDQNLLNTVSLGGDVSVGTVQPTEPYFLDFHYRRCLYLDAFNYPTRRWGQVSGTLTNANIGSEIMGINTLVHTTGAVAGNACNSVRAIVMPRETTLKLVALWTYAAALSSTPRRFQIRLSNNGPAVGHDAYIEHYNRQATVAQDRWRYYDQGTGAWENFAGGGERINSSGALPYWHYLELSLNWAAGDSRITDLRTNQLNLTGLNLQTPSGGATDSSWSMINIYFETDVALATIGWIGFIGVFEV
jgi:hypothetical protein